MKRTDYINWDEYFMGIALLTAMRSKDPNSQVGACIVSSENKILSLGYNGMPIGCSDDEMPWEREGAPLDTKYMYVCPAEHPRHMQDGLHQPPRGFGRAYLGDLPPMLGPQSIDSVGGTALLIRADLHRNGLNFPAFSHRGYIETEGLAMIAKDMGHTCWALPELIITHADA